MVSVGRRWRRKGGSEGRELGGEVGRERWDGRERLGGVGGGLGRDVCEWVG